MELLVMTVAHPCLKYQQPAHGDLIDHSDKSFIFPSLWRRKVIHRRYEQQENNDPDDQISLPTRSFNEHLEQLAMVKHRLALTDGSAKVFQWRGHSVGLVFIDFFGMFGLTVAMLKF